MFDLDKWQEILLSLRHNKLRTAMTALGVFWGIFMLVLMLGCGNGLRAGVERNLIGFATNSVYVWGQRTAKPFEGRKVGRSIRFTTQDSDALRRVPGVDRLAPRTRLGRDGATVTRGTRSGVFQVSGDYPDLPAIEGFDVHEGRFINPIDIDALRKVVVLGQEARRILFDDAEDPIGQTISVRGISLRVIGVLVSGRPGDNGDRENSAIYLPFTTFQRCFNGGNSVGWFALTAEPFFDAALLETDVRRTLASRHGIAPDDLAALGSLNAAVQFQHVENLFTGVTWFIWLVGIATLAAGVLGVSNIMLISVKERTKEIGVRKALGATPWSVVAMVLQEAAALTSLSGYAGLVSGVLTLELIARSVPSRGSSPFGAPSVDIQAALIATFVLIIAGILSGVPPAHHAAKIRPVVALRSE